MSTKHIYIVRHAESDANKSRIRRGGDTPLTETGLEQAHKVAERFTRIPIDIVFSSPYVRAQQTAAAIVAATGVPYEEMPSAHERRQPSSVIGVHKDLPEVKDAIAYVERSWRTGSEPHSDEERFEEIRARANDVMRQLTTRSEEHIALVTHSAFMRALLARIFFGEDFTGNHFYDMFHNSRMSNTGITYVTYSLDDGWELITWNDCTHLG